jgi:hypothetical protein
MKTVYVICEGQTEEAFINEIAKGFSNQHVILTPILLGKRGGHFSYSRVLNHIQSLLQHKQAYCTTLFDFYGLPDDFPGKQEAMSKRGVDEKADCLLDVFKKKLEESLDYNQMQRFISYVQMYEFEGLLFSDPENFAQGINKPELTLEFQKIKAAFGSPEAINNSKETAPSKRIMKLYPGYNKPTHGLLAVKEIGLSLIRKECPRFDAWLKKLETLL